MGFLKFLFFVIIFYYLFKLFSRYVLPYLLSIFIRRAQDEMMGNGGSKHETRDRKKEGKVSVDFSKGKESKGKKDELGEYIDFEEVED